MFSSSRVIKFKQVLSSGDRLATIDMSQKGGLLCPFQGRGTGSPSNAMWPVPRPTSVPSGILIHPTVWPQCTNATDIQTGQGRQRTNSIGQTVLQMVAPKTRKLKFCRSIKVQLPSSCPFSISRRDTAIPSEL